MSALPGRLREARLAIAGVEAVLGPEGALWLPGERALLVADLHFEKGSAQLARGYVVPPYDTAATLDALERAVARHDPARLVSLGDAFHDVAGPTRLIPRDRERLVALTTGRDLVWITGNHDPVIAGDLPGERAAELRLGPLMLRHEPSPGAAPGEIAGHLHPAAVLRGGPRTVRRKCLASDGARAVLPAFGTYAGGLDLANPALRRLFDPRALVAYMLSDGQVFPVAGRRCL